MKHISLKFSALLIPYYAMWAIGPGFFVVILEQKGIAANECAIFTCLISLTAAFVQPLMGFLCDKTGKARTILSVCSILTVAAYTWLYFLDGKIPLVLCSILIGATINAMYGFSEGWLSKLDCDKLGVNFGAVRSIGSLSYAVTAGVYGQLFDIFGAVSLPIAMAVSTLVLIPVAMLCPNPQISEKQKDSGNFVVIFRELLKNRRFVLLIICYALAVLPTGAATSYYAIHIRQLGGTAGDVGMALFILAGVEFLTMPFYKKLERKFGAEKLLVVAFFMYGVKNLAIGLSGNVTFALLASVTQAGCFSLSLPGVQSYVDQITPREYAATAQLVSNTCGQIISQIIGLALCGVLTTYISAGAALAWLSITAFAGCIIFALGIRKISRR
ncbi:MAG: MFS transporter [Oscillospiraceae bacterium]|nr:MFS transporter [Oscillospiraceae bacterium]